MAKVTPQKGLLWPVLLDIYVWNASQQNGTKSTVGQEYYMYLNKQLHN